MKILNSIKRNPKQFLFSLFIGITATWGLCEPFISIAFVDINKYWFLFIFGLTSLIIALIRICPKNSVNFKLKNTNTTMSLKFGNIFDENGVIAISVNEYFDSEIGKPVSEKSLHGYFIKNVLGEKKEIFDKSIDTSLKNVVSEKIKREIGKPKKYPIGTTAVCEFGERKYLLFALSKTNKKYEAYTNPSLLMQALDGLLVKARSECNGTKLSLPLIGTGLSRSGIPVNNIIEMIFVAILVASKQADVTKEICIVIDNSNFENIDLKQIMDRWK